MTDINLDARWAQPSVTVRDDEIFIFFGDDCIAFSNIEDRVTFLKNFKKKIEEAIEKIS